MAKRPWYARTTWTETDRTEVLVRLRETVGANEQAACLRKQAAHLLAQALKLGRRDPAGASRDQLLAGARELNELFLAWFPDSADRAYALTALGDIEAESGNTDAALDHYRTALAAQVDSTRSTNAHLRFAMVVVGRELTPHFGEALQILEMHAQPLIYPLEQYQHCGARALLLASAGQRRTHALLCAQDALAATRYAAIDENTSFHHRLVQLSETGSVKPASDASDTSATSDNRNLKPKDPTHDVP